MKLTLEEKIAELKSTAAALLEIINTGLEVLVDAGITATKNRMTKLEKGQKQ